MVVNLIGAVVFQNRKAIREGEDKESEIFEMVIIAEGDLEKELVFPKKQMLNNPGIIYEVIDYYYIQKSDAKFPI